LIASIHTRQLSIREILKFGVYIWLRRFYTFLPFLLLTFLPVFLIKRFAPLNLLQQSLGEGGYLLFSIFIRFIFSILGILSISAVSYIVENVIQGKEVGWAGALRFAFSRWGVAILTYLLMEIILLGLTFLLVIPAVIWTNYYSFYLNAVANRGLNYRAALNYSKDLVKSRWWHIFWRGLGLAFAVILPALGVGFILSRLIPARIFEGIWDFIICMSINLLTVVESVWFLNLDYLRHEEQSSSGNSNNTKPAEAPEAVFF
jgi:hypothetical protein